MIERRVLLATLLGAGDAFVGAAAHAQARRRVGVLLLALVEDAPAVALFRGRLESLGQIEGRTIDLTFYVAREPGQLAGLASEATAARPDILVAMNTQALDALRAVTGTIPIVVVNAGDPVALGHSTSWARPSGNITGILTGVDTLSDKRVELLHEMLPSARMFGILYDPTNRLHHVVLARTRTAMQSLGLALRPYPVGDVRELGQIAVRAAADGVGALIVTPSPSILYHRATLVAAALAHRLPTMHAFSFEAFEGAVVAYGTEPGENWQRAADYVNRLLHGEPVASLPFEQSVRVALTLNLRTARTIGLDVPLSVVARADEVIE